MGLSSSQARLLTLTGRMHDIEYRAQKLEAQKLQLANESRQVYEEYLNALEMTKIQNKIFNTDGSITFIDSTYNNLIGKNLYDNKIYTLCDLSTGRVYVDEIYKGAYDSSNKTLNGFLKTLDSIMSNEDAPYISVTSAEDLMAMSRSSGNYRLDCDIVLKDWQGISNFKGILDGNGHTITIDGGDSGLFKNLNGATVRNLNINANITTENSNIGALAGVARNATIENVGTSGNITAKDTIGGLIGYTQGTTSISNCFSDVNVYSNYVSPTNGVDDADRDAYHSIVGGLIGVADRGGNANLTVTDSISRGDVKAEYWFAGGFIGQIDSDITLVNCETSSNVVGNCSGHGDDFDTARLTYPNGDRYIPYVSAFSGAPFDAYTITVTNCNSIGTVKANGDPANTDVSDFGWVGTSPEFNNYYSSVNSSSSTTLSPNIFEWNINPADYNNMSEEEINEATRIFSLLDKYNGGICVPKGCENSAEWLSNVITGGYAFLGEIILKENGFILTETSVAIDVNLQEIQNDINIRKCEAKYEADMRRIDLKDRKYDTDLAAIESERNAIKQEIETLKTVARENTERTFRLFG